MHNQKVGDTPSVRQLTLDFSEGFFVSDPHPAQRDITRTIVFPKHIDDPEFRPLSAPGECDVCPARDFS